MKIFNRLKSKSGQDSDDPSKKLSQQLGDLSGLSQPFKKAAKSDLERSHYQAELAKFEKLPVRMLEVSTEMLTRLNRFVMKPKQRRELADYFLSQIYPVVAMWYKKYQAEENSLPESNERRNAMVASIAAIQQLVVPYKLLFVEYYHADKNEFKKSGAEAEFYAFRSMELIRLEQRLRALRYQKLPKISWQHSNQIFFSLIHHNAVDTEQSLVGIIGLEKKTDKLRQGSVPKSNVRWLYLSVQLFGLLDVTTWPTRLFHLPDTYLNYMPDALKIMADDGKELGPGFLLTHYRNEMPLAFKRSVNQRPPTLRINYSSLFNTLVKDHQELGKQQFLNHDDPSAYSKPLNDIAIHDRVPVLELMIMGLTERERRQKRHASFDSSSLSVYFGFKEVNRLLLDMSNPDKLRVKESREFIDTLARQSAMLADDDKNYMSASWTISNFSAGGLLIGTDETDFSNPIQIDQLVAFIMPENKEQPILGFVRRLNRPDGNRVEVVIVRLSNHAETAAIQNQDELDSDQAKAAILIKDIRNEWALIIQSNVPYKKGQPLKLIRANGERLPVRLGEPVYVKKDFKVFELRSPGLS